MSEHWFYRVEWECKRGHVTVDSGICTDDDNYGVSIDCSCGSLAKNTLHVAGPEGCLVTWEEMHA